MKTVKPKIVVVGSINMDLVYTVPDIVIKGETLHSSNHEVFFGGKGANQAVTAGQLGASVQFVGNVGVDEFGEQAKANLTSKGVSVGGVQSVGMTGQAIIQVSEEGENAIVLFPGANFFITPGQVEQSTSTIEESDLLLLQLEIPLDAVEKAAEIAHEKGVKVILNPAPARDLPDSLLSKVSILTPNETELEILTGISGTSEAELKKACGQLIEKGVQAVVVTLGSKGSFYMTANESDFVSAEVVKVKDTTGAGDAFNGALAVGLCKGETLRESIQFASKVAAYVVTKSGAQPMIIEDFI
ncbi:ribokinase [Sporosarcina sp. CAU 1771]